MPFIKVTEDMKKDIIDLYTSGKSALAIKNQLNISPTTILRHLHKEGISTRPLDEQLKLAWADKRKELEKKIKLFYEEEKLSELEISQRLGLARMTVSKYVRALGINRTSQETKNLKGTTLSGPAHWRWRGGIHKVPNRAKSGNYILLKIPDHPRANSAGYVPEHIVVWEEYHHKAVPKGYHIHHLNGITDDNRPQNLVAMKAGEHIHQTEPFKKKIRQLEIENRQLRRALENGQSIFYISEN